MKILLITAFILLFYGSAFGQGGYKKYLGLYKGNAIVSSFIHDDTLYLNSLGNDLINGWFGQIIKLDSFANIIKIDSVFRGEINNFGIGSKSSRMITKATTGNSLVSVYIDGAFLDLTISKSTTNLEKVWQKIIKPDFALSGLFASGVTPIHKGYLIYGDIQQLDERVRGFVLRVDEDGNKVYWNLFGQGNNWHEYYGALSLTDTTFVTYGMVSNYSGQNITSLPVWYSIYNAKTGMEIKRYYDSLALDNYNLLKDPFSDGYIGFSDTVNKDTTARFPHAVWYDAEFRVKRKTAFGIQDPKDWHYLYSEKPYHSTMDAEGNLYAATTGYLPLFQPSQPLEEVSEVLTVTKISPQGDIIWETIDTVFFDQINGYGYVDFVSGINVSSTGSVYVVGTINAIIPPDTTYRGNGWIIKYDKHGCIVDNCRLVSTIDTDVDNSNFLLYPNPANDVLNISYSATTTHESYVHIYDITGSLILNQSLYDSVTTIDINLLPVGFYVVSVYDGIKKIASKKFIKH